MVGVALFFIIILTVTEAASLHCGFDQHLPASGDDGFPDVQQVEYCLIDDCTMIRIDTGERLDIVCTTNNLIITTPTDGRTSTVVIVKQQNELPCYGLGVDDQKVYFVPSVLFCALSIVAGGYIAGLHLVFKKL